jgi:hypothetical protein
MAKDHKHSWLFYGVILSRPVRLLVKCRCGAVGKVDMDRVPIDDNSVRFYFGTKCELPLAEQLVPYVESEL